MVVFICFKQEESQEVKRLSEQISEVRKAQKVLRSLCQSFFRLEGPKN